MSRDGSPVRVLVADDHRGFADALALAIDEREDLELVGQAREGADALALIRARQPAVALLAVGLPMIGGLDLLAALRSTGMPVRAVLLAARVDAETARRAIARGAAGCLSVEAPVEEICDAVIAVARGELVLTTRSRDAVADDLRIRTGAVTEPAPEVGSGFDRGADRA